MMTNKGNTILVVIIGIVIGLLAIGAISFLNQKELPSPIDLEDDVKEVEEVTTDKNMNTVILKTNMGDIAIELSREDAPNTVENFEELSKKGFYDGTRFHRVIPNFMIQGGDPQSKDVTLKSVWGTGGPGYQFADEIHANNNNARGTISMANAGPDTNGSQFFINTVDNTGLNPKHTVFGKVVAGMEVVDAIQNVETEHPDRPINDVIIESVELK